MWQAVVEWARVAALVLAGLGVARLLLTLAVVKAWQSRNRVARLLLVGVWMLRVMASTAKVYAPRNRGTALPEFSFGMIFLRDQVEEVHEFVARPTMGWQDMRGLVPLLGGRSRDMDQDMIGHAVRVIDRLVRRALRNDDGTPERWQAHIYTADDDGKQYFNDPQGNRTPVDLLGGFEAFEAGSSRRRWAHLMEDDDEVTVELDQMVELMEDIISAVSDDRPTTKSEPS